MAVSTAFAVLLPDSEATVTELVPGGPRRPHRRGVRRGADEPARRAASAAADSYADVLERLFASYEARHPLRWITAVTAQARAELQAQVPRQVQPELLERLVRIRLDAVESEPATSQRGPRE